MSDFKHTPGPWVAGRPDMSSTSLVTGKWVWGPEPAVVTGGDGEVHIRVHGVALAIHPDGGNWPETLANARLISKAPEMRDLLFELFEDPDVQLILGGNPIRIHALTDRAVALIDYLKRET
jgi:hypothetical protein